VANIHFIDSENENRSEEDNPHISNESTAEDDQNTQPARPTKTAQRKRKRPRNDPFSDQGTKQQMVSRQQQQQQQPPMPQQMAQGQVLAQPQNEKKNPLKLRLDLNLDVEIELRAKIHGDVTLALL
jgi:hypothetical protein